MKLSKHLLSTFILTALLSNITIAAETQLDKIEAVVNQELILSSDISNMKRDVIKNYKESGKALPNPKDFNKQILDKLINDKVQLQIANATGLRISDAQVDQAIEGIAKKENKTIAEMRREIEKSGLNYNAYIDSIRNELTINEIRQIQVQRRINITDQEVEQMIERINKQGQASIQFNFAHILLKVSSETSPEKKLAIDKTANLLIKKIKGGEDINQLATTYSEGPKALEGGNWGWRKMDAIPSLLINNIKPSNKKGDVIGPFRSKIGVHIIKILDKKGTASVMTEEVHARHILLKPNVVLNDKKAKQLLVTLRQDILDGTKTFKELAKKYSKDPGSAIKGGDLGWADPTVYVPEFRDATLSQKIGDISQPFRTTHGWHILQVLEKRKSDITKKATKQKAYNILYRQRFPYEAYAWLNEIRQEAYVKISNPDYIIEEN